ncbi:GumC family protein [Calothrix rhizosoleniae]|uniref:GumC family protein n=1 Tax=Calothrix rhizosoleniae TaxID=888997 RepID=UPI000B49C7B7|nr:polysaccharide biosynthesis tyrosine autokinase [Calothrix rhizosoleniae]
MHNIETQGHLEEEFDIQQYWLVLKRRWLIAAAVFCTSVGLSGFFVLRQKPQYEASGMLLFKSDRISSLTKAGGKVGDLESIKREGNPLETQAVIVNSQPILQEVVNTLGLKDDKGKTLDIESLKVKVEPVIGTDVLKVAYTSDNPEIAAAVVNQLMKAYIDNNIASNRTQVIAAGEFIKRRIPFAKRELNSATEALRLFRLRHNTVNLTEESRAALNNISKLNEQIDQAKTGLSDIKAQETEMKSQLNLADKQALEITSLNQIPGVQQVLNEQQKVQAKIATLTGKYTDSHPIINDLKKQELALATLLNKRIEGALGSNRQYISPKNLQMGKIKEEIVGRYIQLSTQSQGLEKKLQTLFNLRENYQKKLSILPNLEKSQGNLERRLSIAKTDYENLVTRLQEIEVAEKQTIGNARIVEPALIPKKTIISKMTLLLLGGGVFVGSLLGVSAAFFVDLVDRTLKTTKEIEKFFGYTMLGFIPKFETSRVSPSLKMMAENVSHRVIAASSPRTAIHEAHQMLQANLKFISHKKVRTIVITSSVPGEGKSEIAANLATVIAQTGQRVLLIDADMRRPSQHHLWGQTNSSGLSNIIVGQDDFSLAVNKITNYLSVLTAGIQPPNPLALIDSDGMASLIKNLSTEFDYILFDTPPLTGIADAAVLGKMVDGLLLVARPKVVDSASAESAKSLLARSEANILGIVANAVNVKQESNNYFHYADPRGNQSVNEVVVGGKQWISK